MRAGISLRPGQFRSNMLFWKLLRNVPAMLSADSWKNADYMKLCSFPDIKTGPDQG